MDSLQWMLDRQAELQRHQLNGRRPQQLSGNERVFFLKDMALANLNEIHEMLGEIGWKPWATSRHVNIMAAKGEMVDEFHFFMNRWLALGGTAEELVKMYTEKANRNEARWKNGYTGLEKCPGCHRAWDDIDAHRLPEDQGYRYYAQDLDMKFHSIDCYRDYLREHDARV